MKQITISFCLILPLLFSGCKKCGEDVNLGDYEVTEQSKTDWFPFISADKLSFENENGDSIEIKIANRKDEMEYINFRDICKGTKLNDAAKEFYRSEKLLVEYSAFYGDNTFFLSAILNVDRIVIQGNTSYFNLFDKIIYRMRIQDYNSAENLNISGEVTLVADKRENAIENEDLWHGDPIKFAEQIILNGKTFQNVWYHESDGVPTLYVQQGKGIIAFRGFNGQVWVLKGNG